MINVLKNNCGLIPEYADFAHFISVFCPRIGVICVTFCYTADKLKSGEKHFKSWNNQGKLKLKNNGHSVEINKLIWMYLSLLFSDEEDAPMIRGFSDDEPLVIA